MNSIFLLGGTGFVGTQVCNRLIAQSYRVTVPTRGCIRARQWPPSVRLLVFDVHDERALTHALTGHSAVVNLVAILHGNQAAFTQVHVVLPQKLARACVALNLKNWSMSARLVLMAGSHYLRPQCTCAARGKARRN